ncbi:zinc-ribbon domain-containing protein [Carboxylicivirga caseinilyticus]|uniref:zinc-ribbon domain-containing protein n=1 Tax=Carboxylicivirga caseinilyticus TaxID=3417572 RepID=UPI003D332173|nr:zinc-ribbon domain-containing protein [Marinilabiliaceae bacterium A049]
MAMIIFGRRKVRIKKYNNSHIKCEECGSFQQQFSVYQEYFHIFFIPVFPTSVKTIRTVCLNCKDTFNQEKVNHYLSITKTPIYMYSGLILFALLIITGVYANNESQKKRVEYVSSPKVSDVYLIQQNDDGPTFYYFLKIISIDSDTVELLHSSLQYNQFVTNMTDSDFFVLDDGFKVLKSDLKVFLDDGMIRSVERDYDAASQFMIEK